jgi:RNA polymerase sigma-70 factor, ECF subfamily
MDALDEHIRGCLSGDRDRFAEIVKACEPKVRAVLAAMTPDPNAVPDLTQEVFVIAYQRLASYQPGTNFSAWLRAIARNVAQNERRRWYRRQEMEARYQAQAEARIAENIDRFIESLPEEVLESLRGCVAGLGGRTRSLVERVYYGECSLKEVAELLQFSSSAARVALHRARQALGKCLQKKGAA